MPTHIERIRKVKGPRKVLTKAEFLEGKAGRLPPSKPIINKTTGGCRTHSGKV